METGRQLGITVSLAIHVSANLCECVIAGVNHAVVDLAMPMLLQGTDFISCLHKSQGRIMDHSELFSYFFF